MCFMEQSKRKHENVSDADELKPKPQGFGPHAPPGSLDQTPPEEGGEDEPTETQPGGKDSAPDTSGAALQPRGPDSSPA